MLEFARLFPSVTEDLLMRVTDLPFNYHTKSEIFFEKVEKGYLSIMEMPVIPKQQSQALDPQDIALLDDYRKAYLEGVCQLTIRGQTTKDHMGTLPLSVCL